MYYENQKRMIKTTSKWCVLAATTILLGACSGTPKPKTEMALSNAAVQNAEVAGATELAPIELRTAKEKQALANNALSSKNYLTAKQLSEQAAVDAELAKAKSEAEKSRAAVKEVEDSIDVIRAELGE